ncbi:TPA: type II toxin-antitoxin system HicB family antitoxin [Elizabethkingia anophelis]
MGFLKYKNYTGSVEFNDTDKILFGKVLGIRGLISYEGQTVDELEQDFKSGIDEYLEACKEKGIEPQKPYTGAFNIRIPSDMHGQAAMEAYEQGITLNAFVKHAIEERLKIAIIERKPLAHGPAKKENKEKKAGRYKI